MKKAIQYLRLMALIMRRGKFRYSGIDPGKRRVEMLQDLKQFSRPKDRKGRDAVLKWISRNSYLKAFFAQLAFFITSLKSEGGHVSVDPLDLAYLRNPRAASTALCYSLLQARYPDLKEHAVSPEQINFLTDVNLQRKLGLCDAEKTFFTVVRNPFARIVSVYRQFFEGDPPYFIYEDYLFGILKKNISFKGFVKALQLIPNDLKDQHFRPQCDLLAYYASKNTDVKILKLEEPEDIRNFLSRYQLALPTINVSSGRYDYREYYDKETLERVYDLYSGDVALFGYGDVYQELLIGVTQNS